MKTIWKFPLTSNSYNTIEMPQGAEIKTVIVQDNQLCLWALVDTEQPKEQRNFAIFGTGEPLIDGPLKFIDTFGYSNNAYVFHVFEHISKPERDHA